MSKRLMNSSGDVRELTKKDMKAFKPASAVLPSTLLKTLSINEHGSPKRPSKIPSTTA